jgi:hypothetical protein
MGECPRMPSKPSPGICSTSSGERYYTNYTIGFCDSSHISFYVSSDKLTPLKNDAVIVVIRFSSLEGKVIGTALLFEQVIREQMDG